MMKVFYINDQMFENDSVQDELRYRFIQHLQHHRIQAIFISLKNPESQALLDFLQTYDKIPVICSPSTFAIHGLEGSIDENALVLNGFSKQEAVDDGCITYDLTNNKVERVYFSMCLNHHLEDDLNFLIEELEQQIQNKIKAFKHKKDDIC